MREAYQQELDLFVGRLAELARLVESALARATTALLDNEPGLANEVIAEEESLREKHHVLDSEALGLLARQQPVATDLRTIVAGLRMSADLERMGILAKHVAEVVHERQPRPVVPDDLHALVRAMADKACLLASLAQAAILTDDTGTTTRLVPGDDEMNRLQESLYRRLLSPGRETTVETAMDLTLIGRYLERFADHAVSLGKRIDFIVGRRNPLPS